MIINNLYGTICVKKYLVLIQFIGFLFFPNDSCCQNTIDETIGLINELSSVQVYANHNLISDWSSVRKDIKFKDFSFSFDPSSSTAKKYQPDLIVSKAKITLFRYNKYTAFTLWQPGSAEPMSVFYSMARSGDRYELELTLVAQNKFGEKVPLKNILIYNFPVY